MISPLLTVQVWGRPPVCRFTEPLAPCPSGRRNAGPEARLTGRPEVCPTFRGEQLPQVNTDSPGQGPRRAREVDEGTDREMSRMQSRGIGKMRLYGPGSPL